WAEEPEVDGVFRGASAHEITGMVAVDRFPGRLFVAVGAVDEGGGWVPASWLSPDGHSWSTPSLAFPDPGPTAPGSGVAAGASLDPGGVTATAVAATTDGFVAVGGAGRGAAGLVWTSSDGRSWVPAALPGPAATAPWQPAVVAAAGSTTVVADRQPGDAHLLVDDPGGWREPTADAATWGSPAPVATPVGLGTDAAGATLVVDVRTPGQTLGPVTHSTVVLTSPDATAWQVVAAPAFGAATVAATSPALRTAVGSEPGAGGTPVAAVFTSPDGQQWQPSPAAPGAFGGTGVAERATAALELAAGGPLVVGTGAAPGSTSGGAPLAWTATHGSFGAPVDLEGADSLAVATPTGACQAASGIVAAVGVASRDDAVAPRAWVTTGAGATSSWRPTTVAAPTGGAAAVEGCSLIGGHLVAWGTLATATGGTQPALWDSSDAASWASRRVDAFDQAGREGGAPGLVALAASGDDWLAAGGAAPAPATGAGGATGLWRSADGGRTFTRVATSAAPFTATGRESLDVVGWLGSTGIVAGDVDGRLAVWTVTGD
ncbi:MAG TPA: hypothetical protein VFP61_12735, partial [Acidimicrobiales bacterium]|nr:hypothetical protein [Acidimicrobiales bacterium]